MIRASVHGRFQPFHNGHLGYIEAALRRADHLYIGLTRVLTEPGIGGDLAPHRLRMRDNPFTYYQRCAIVQAALDSEGVDRSRWSVGPFPIEAPDRLPEFWPTEGLCLTTIVDAWNEEKVRVLRSHGYEVEILDVAPSDRIRTGTAVREGLRMGGDAWKSWTPEGAWPLLERWRGRLGAG